MFDIFSYEFINKDLPGVKVSLPAKTEEAAWDAFWEALMEIEMNNPIEIPMENWEMKR